MIVLLEVIAYGLWCCAAGVIAGWWLHKDLKR